MITKIPTRKEITTVRMIVNDEELIVDGYVHYYEDRCYGADADGNRASCKIFVEDVTDIDAINLDGDDVVLTANQLDLAAQLLTDKFLEG